MEDFKVKIVVCGVYIDSKEYRIAFVVPPSLGRLLFFDEWVEYIPKHWIILKTSLRSREPNLIDMVLNEDFVCKVYA